jgi:hypothetical protein
MSAPALVNSTTHCLHPSALPLQDKEIHFSIHMSMLKMKKSIFCELSDYRGFPAAAQWSGVPPLKLFCALRFALTLINALVASMFPQRQAT